MRGYLPLSYYHHHHHQNTPCVEWVRVASGSLLQIYAPTMQTYSCYLTKVCKICTVTLCSLHDFQPAVYCCITILFLKTTRQRAMTNNNCISVIKHSVPGPGVMTSINIQSITFRNNNNDDDNEVIDFILSLPTQFIIPHFLLIRRNSNNVRRRVSR
jgi:hypothetical protein